MKLLLSVSACLLLLAGSLQAQSYQGPESGSITGGVIVNTDDFLSAPISPEPERRVIPNLFDAGDVPRPSDLPAPLWPETHNAFEYDPDAISPIGPPPIQMESFDGIPDLGTTIPPDPHAAVGPNHILATVNSRFRISDKEGNTLKTITASTWYQSVLPSASPFDPQIMYDHFNSRWIMLWDHLNETNATAYWLISVSDDDDPQGIWYNWALPAHLNGSTPSGNWGDYPGIGYDDEALYIVSREFTFGFLYQYPKIRIVGTAQLYQNNAGPVTWTDLWAITDPSGLIHDGLRPSVVFTNPPEYYLIAPTTFFGTNVSIALYRLTNPLTSPVLTGVSVPVASWTPAPNASQPGGGLSIEGGGSRVRHAAVYRDSSIWAAHSVANGAYSSIRYVRISTVTNAVLEDARLGATGFWHFYPSLMVDSDENVAITFSRSGTTEYIGAGMMWRFASDGVGLRPAVMFKDGEAYYVKDFGSGRNRWGDYMGIALDPADNNNFWMFTEYADSPDNTWGTWWLNARLVPYATQRVLTSPQAHDFDVLEVGSVPETLSVSVFNVGTPDLTITNVANSHPAYTLTGLPSLPVVLSTYDSIAFTVLFDPIAHGDAIDSITVTSNDPDNPNANIQLDGRGIVIGSASVGRTYAASGPLDGQLYSMDITSATPTLIGSLAVDEVQGLAIRPTTLEIYGVKSTSVSTTLYRIASDFGDALTLSTIPVANMRAIAFSGGDTLYGATTSGDLYRVDPLTGNATLVGNASGVVYAGISFSPTSGVLWASVRPPLANKDRIYTVNRSTGQATLIGQTGFSTRIHPSIVFDPAGRLFAITGSGTQTNELISIDTLTAAGTLIGSTGLTGLNALAMRTDSTLVSVGEADQQIPIVFSLEQNYPNPFNPTTTFSLTIPQSSIVNLTVYDLLGREIATLVNEKLAPGRYTREWDAANHPSGVYFYRLSTSNFVQTKKLVLLR